MTRTWMVRWLLAAAAAHVLVGALLPWAANSPLLDGYRRGIEAAFWPDGAPPPAHALQAWWLALFGPTLQAMGLWMLALVHAGARLRQPSIWLWLAGGLLVWAPQDVAISLRAACWPHVWADAGALALMLPPLAWLWQHDRRVAA